MSHTRNDIRDGATCKSRPSEARPGAVGGASHERNRGQGPKRWSAAP